MKLEGEYFLNKTKRIVNKIVIKIYIDNGDICCNSIDFNWIFQMELIELEKRELLSIGLMSVTLGFVNSSEYKFGHLNDNSSIDDYYWRYLGRRIGVGEELLWPSIEENRKEILGTILASPEYRRDRGTLEWIQGLYEQVLGREGGATELGQWLILMGESEKIEKDGTQSTTAILKLNDGEIISGYIDTAHVRDGHYVGWSLWSPGSRRIDLGPLPDSGVGDGGDPEFATYKDRLYLVTESLANNRFQTPDILIYISEDGGKTFEIGGRVAPQWGGDSGPQLDKPNIAVAGDGTIYVVYRVFNDLTQSGAQLDGIYLSLSKDGGRTFKDLGIIPGTRGQGGQGQKIWIDGTGRLWLANYAGSCFGLTYSDDGGITWPRFEMQVGSLQSLFPNGGGGYGFRSNAFPHIAFGNNNIYLTYADLGKIELIWSKDGLVWSDPIVIGSGWGPWIASNGKEIGIFWYSGDVIAGYYTVLYKELQIKNDDSGIIDNGIIAQLGGYEPIIYGKDPYLVDDYWSDYDEATGDKDWFYTGFGSPDVTLLKVPI